MENKISLPFATMVRQSYSTGTNTQTHAETVVGSLTHTHHRQMYMHLKEASTLSWKLGLRYNRILSPL